MKEGDPECLLGLGSSRTVKKKITFGFMGKNIITLKGVLT